MHTIKIVGVLGMSKDTTSPGGGSYWNYRILRQEYTVDGEEPCVEYKIVEAYYEDGRPVAYCAPHVVGDDVEESRRVLAMMHEAFEKPVLASGDFSGPWKAMEGGTPSPQERSLTQAGGTKPDASSADSGDEQ